MAGISQALLRQLAAAAAAAAGGGAAARPAAPKHASWSVQRALLTPQVNRGSRYRCGQSTLRAACEPRREEKAWNRSQNDARSQAAAAPLWRTAQLAEYGGGGPVVRYEHTDDVHNNTFRALRIIDPGTYVVTSLLAAPPPHASLDSVQDP